MKKIKYVLYGLLALVILLLVAAIFLPKDYSAITNRTVDTSPAYIYNLVTDMGSRQEWDSNMQMSNDSSKIVTITEMNDGYSWKGESTQGSFSITESVKNEKVNYQYLDEDGDPCCSGTIAMSGSGNKTEVLMSHNETSSWPMNLFNFYKKWQQGKKMDKALSTIADIAQQRSDKNIYNGYTIVEEVVKEKNFLMKRDEVSTASVQQFYVQNLGVLFANVQEAGLQMDGMPSALFFNYNTKKGIVDMAAGIPVTEEVNVPDASSIYIPSRKGVVVDYYGDYNETQKAHDAIEDFFNDHGMISDVPKIEEYVTDPSKVKDPSKWLTKIIYYIAE